MKRFLQNLRPGFVKTSAPPPDTSALARAEDAWSDTGLTALEDANPCSIAVVSGPRAGAGGTTLIAHWAVFALQRGVTVGVLDLQGDHADLTYWLHARRAGMDDAVTPAGLVDDAEGHRVLRDVSRAPLHATRLIAALRPHCSLLLVDAPAGAHPVTRAALAHADWAISVAVDSAQGAGSFFPAHPDAQATRPGAYGRMIWDERRRRISLSRRPLSWGLVRCRSVETSPATAAACQEAWTQTSRLLGAQPLASLPEHGAWRQGWEQGRTGLDTPQTATIGQAGLLRLCETVSVPALEAQAVAS